MDEKLILKPCPFCGHLPIVKKVGTKRRVECSNKKCPVHPTTQTFENGLHINVWNYRYNSYIAEN